MALANIAEIFFRKNLRVLAVDFDLEAPGLDRFYDIPQSICKYNDILSSRGLIDLLLSYKDNYSLSKMLNNSKEDLFPKKLEPLSNFIIPIYKSLDSKASLSLMTAGRREEDEFKNFSDIVRSFDWIDFYNNWDGEKFFDWFRRESEAVFDVVLIDSRTGITEMGGVCTHQLADAVLIFVAPNQQNLDGALKVAQSLLNPELVEKGRRGRKLSLVVIPSRIEDSEADFVDAFAKKFNNQFSKLMPGNITINNNAFLELKIPYRTYYSYNENVAVREYERASAADLIKAFERIASVISQLAAADSEIYKLYNLQQVKPYINKQKVPMQKPHRPMHFVGREKELISLLNDLQPGRIITLCGPGGIGKTALAIEAIWKLAPNNDPPKHFPDGIIFHSFYHQPQVALAFESIARAYNEELKPNPAEAAKNALSGRSALIVLDSAEAADDLNSILTIIGRCGVLITTRRHSDAPTEWIDLAPLSLDQGLILLRELGGEYASDDIASQKICMLLGGLPLAIFLAGKYMAQYHQGAVEYLAWLEETPLEALDLGNKLYQSIPLLIKQSLAQLSDKAIVVLSIIGILSLEPFDPKLITIALKYKPQEVSRYLGQLVDFGLLLRVDSRYQVFHILVHTYAQKFLIPDPSSYARLGEYYSIFIEEQNRLGMRGYVLLDTHRSHILSVQSACLKAGEFKVVCKIAYAIDDYLDSQGHWLERLTVAEAGLYAAQSDNNRFNEMTFLALLGKTYHNFGEYRRAIDFHDRSLKIAKEIEDIRGECFALINLGNSYCGLGEYGHAIEFYKKALGISQDLGNTQDQIASLEALGEAYDLLGNTHNAIECREKAFALSQDTGNPQNQAVYLAAIGKNYAKSGDMQKAKEFLEKALVISQELGNRRDQAASLAALGRTYTALGETPKAIESLERALVISQELGNRQNQAANLAALGRIYTTQGKINEAIEFLEKSLIISKEIGNRQGQAANLGALGQAYAALNRIPKAIESLEEALLISSEIGDRWGQGANLSALGRAYMALHEPTKAINCFEEALLISQKMKNRSGQAFCLNALGQAYIKLGKLSKAVEFLEMALKITLEIGNERAQAANLGALGKTYAILDKIPEAIEFLRRALAISSKIGDRWGQEANLSALGRAYTTMNEPIKAIDCFEEALAISREIRDHPGQETNLSALSQNYISLGRSYARLGKVSEAVEVLEKALTISEKLDNYQGLVTSLTTLGRIYGTMNETQRAVEHFEKALEITRKIGDRRGQSTILASLSRAYAKLGETRKLIELNKQELEIAKEILDPRREKDALLGLGLAHTKLGEQQKAIEFYQQALTVAKEIGEIHSEKKILVNLGNAYAHSREYYKAIESYQQALVIAREIGDKKGEGNALFRMSLALYKIGEHKQAIERARLALNIYEQIKDIEAKRVSSKLIEWEK